MYFFLLNIRSLFIGYQWVFLSIEIISLISDITMKGFTGSEYSHWFSLNFCLCCSNLSEFEINLNNSSIAGWQRRLVQAGLLGWMRHSNWHIHHQLQTSSLRYPQSTVRSCTPGQSQESRKTNQDPRGSDRHPADKTTGPGFKRESSSKCLKSHPVNLFNPHPSPHLICHNKKFVSSSLFLLLELSPSV